LAAWRLANRHDSGVTPEVAKKARVVPAGHLASDPVPTPLAFLSPFFLVFFRCFSFYDIC
jgi:hypothetical protein